MRPVSAEFVQAANNAHTAKCEVTITPPGSSDASELLISDGSVSVSGEGARYTSSLTLAPDLARDLYGLVSAPGSIFRVRSGIKLGPGQVEWVDAGVYEATAGNKPLQVGTVPLTLSDQSTRLTRCRFMAPYLAAAGTRADALEAMVLDAIPGAVVRKEATGGTMLEGLFDKDRAGALAQISNDGGLDIAFDAAGEYVIKARPILVPTSPVWTARTGKVSNIASASRERPFDRLFNTVIVQPSEEFQTWSPQTVTILDEAHPRHWSKIGYVPFFHTSAMLSSDEDALSAGAAILQTLLTNTERIQLSLLGNPALEYGDTFAVAHEMTPSDPGLAGSYLLETSTLNLKSHAQEAVGRSTTMAELEES